MASRIGKGVELGPPERGKGAASRPERGRVCDHLGCQTILSTYNSSVVCWTHAEPSYRHPLSHK
ncbi:MAG: hypothetical protein HY240_01260 [Actinobacteria bacterium]|nr:hypothetical protein [Actinomycetota bacterium]